MKDRASHDGKGSVPHISADTSLRSTFPARSAASRAVRHASLKKRAFVPQDKSSFFVCHVNTMDQFPSWWHKTVTQRSGHSFEARSSGASSHFVPLHHDPATRSRCRSEETPRPAKRPRRKAGARAKRGVSELVPCEHYGSIPTLAAQTCDPAEAVTGLKRGAAEHVRDDFLCRA